MASHRGRRSWSRRDCAFLGAFLAFNIVILLLPFGIEDEHWRSTLSAVSFVAFLTLKNKSGPAWLKVCTLVLWAVMPVAVLVS